MTKYDNNNEILTLSDLSKYLKVSERTILRMLNKGEIPATKVSGQWRFLKSVIDDWLITNMQKGKSTSFSTLIETGEIKIRLSRIIHPSLIILDLKEGSKLDMLKQLIAPLVNIGYIKEPDKYLELLLEREKMVSTALSNGIAIPHIRNLKDNPQKDPAVVLGVCKNGVDYGSIDGKKTHLFFLICANNDVVHLKIIAKINAFAYKRDNFSALMKVETVEEVIKIISSFDEVIKN